ncbi:transcription repressor NadR [Mesotoga sp.]|uniref:transcription repressor NadR n=1 Tax=Mesotoga sp. TaxID=2053577 RepID=UPI0026352883|nr:transcription repressor NadR [Mesotoga sp.]MDD4206422.1 transcription repressor NadR [Mesotoga sp.]MDI9368465.1 transcription repressor NadR [Thermotogota bacterium]
MEKRERQRFIIEVLKRSTGPVKGQSLSIETGVSRQMIVKDIEELRQREFNILASTRGYVLKGRKSHKMVLSVKHSEEDIYKELSAIIRAGGRIIDVSIIHAVYGELKGKLNLSNMDDLNRFIAALKASHAAPLLSLSKDGVHLHTIEADTEDTLRSIREKLERNGFLVT